MANACHNFNFNLNYYYSRKTTNSIITKITISIAITTKEIPKIC